MQEVPGKDLGHDSTLVTRWAGGSTQLWLESRLYHLVHVFLLTFQTLVFSSVEWEQYLIFLHNVLGIQREDAFNVHSTLPGTHQKGKKMLYL